MNKYQFLAPNTLGLPHYVVKFGRISFIILLIMVSFLFLPWQQTIQGEGVIIAQEPTERAYSVLSTIDGFIKEFYVSENQFVTKGTPLFQMIDLDDHYIEKLRKIEINIKEQMLNTQEEVLLLKERHSNLKKYLTVGLTVYVEKLSQIQDKIISLQLKQVSLAKSHGIEMLNFQRIKTLYKEGIQSKRTSETAENTEVKAYAELEKNRVDIEIENKNTTILENEKDKFLTDTQNKIKSLEALILSSKNKLASLQEKSQLQSMNISRYKTSKAYAPKDGYVVRLYENDSNKFIKKGEKILYFSPKITEKTLLLKVSDFNMPLMKEGLKVRIMFYGWPALQVPGWPTIKFGTFGGVIKSVDHISHEKGFYYAYVVEDPSEPWPSSDVLRVGTQANGWVRLHTVPIWYQMWRLMNALPPEMLTPAKGQK